MGSIKPLTSKINSSITVVSNRGAYTFKDSSQGIQAVPSVSGLVSAVEPLLRNEGGTWIAWGGRYGREDETTGLLLPLPESDNMCVFQEVMLTEREAALFYDGFANSCLWPLCHNFIDKSVFREDFWQAYQRVNEKYAKVILNLHNPQPLIWVHDYHLALLPNYLRRHNPLMRISLFWHIPFPPAEIFTVMPWAEEILKGLLACEVVAFHIDKYVHNFLHSAAAIGAQVDYLTGSVLWAGRIVKVLAAPIGIDWREFERISTDREVIRKAVQIRNNIGGEYLILGVDRLDYTKGIPERLQAVEWLLENYPEYRGKLTFVQIAVPSRIDVPAYASLKRQIEETVGRINGRFTENYNVPVRYLFKALPREELVANYLAADMALVTPLKDGLNLVAKEYVAVKSGGRGVLLLSPFAGAAEQLKQALMANPYNPGEVADQIAAGLRMPPAEKKYRMTMLSKTVKEQDVFWWWKKIRQAWLGDLGLTKEPVAVLPEVIALEPISGKASRSAGAAVRPIV